jgi:hypothetical protein
MGEGWRWRYTKMQGAPKKTSGRSHPWNAPLRATSSGSTKASGMPYLTHSKYRKRFSRLCRNCSEPGKIYVERETRARRLPKSCGKGETNKGFE